MKAQNSAASRLLTKVVYLCRAAANQPGFVLVFGLILSVAGISSNPTLSWAQGQEDEFQDQDADPSETDLDDDGDSAAATALATAQDKSSENPQLASEPTVRRFHEVLDELLAEFGYDVKLGQIKGLKNLAIRKVTVNNALPRSYKTYIRSIVSERIRENSQIRLISCISCTNKTSRMIDGRLVITSPATNMAEMNRAAETLGIDYFMDVVLVYHTTHMVLAFQTFNTDTKEMVWARTYNSETIKSRFQKLAVDYSQVKKSRPGEDYEPEFRLLAGLGGATVPNVSGDPNDEGMMLVYLRATERFDNRTHEFGVGLNLYQTTNDLLSNYPTTGTTADTTTTDGTTSTLTPYKSAIVPYMIYAYNFLGEVESYNATRLALTGGLGTLLASGYFAPMLKVGLDAYFGRSFGVVSSLMYLAASRVQVNNEYRDIAGGVGGEVAFVYNF